MNRIKILGVPVDILTMDRALTWVDEAIKNQTPHQIITTNPEMIMMAQEDDEFFQIMQRAELIIPDGIGVVMAARHLFKVEVPERVTGFDISTNLLKRGVDRDYSFYLLGGAPGIAEQAKENLKKRFPGLNIVGTHHGYLNQENRSTVINDIKESETDILLVGMGAPRQDKFIDQNKERLGVPISIGIGGSIDIWAGVKERAPEMMQKLHLEWFYRLAKEPTRFMRMLALPKFIVFAAKYKECRIK